ncbi:hypothetical protein Q8A73_000825 [Channa argus]|nr:hypothetical protein Q8A73_000825 [Channa argus]
MEKTFSYRRQEVLQGQPMIADFKSRWPALFTAKEIDKEFMRISTVPLLSTFFAELDRYIPRLTEVFRCKGGIAGKKIRQLMLAISKDDNVHTRRACILRSLCIYLNEDHEKLVKEYLDTDLEAHSNMEQTVMGVYVILKDGALPDDDPHDIGVLIEGVEVLTGLGNIALACALRMDKPGLSAAAEPLLLLLFILSVSSVNADTLLSAPLNVTIREVEVNSAIVTWEILEGDPVIGFAITQQKKDVRMLRFIQEVNTTTRSCALWDLDEDTEYIVHVQSISMGGSSPPSQPVLFRTSKESEKMASKSPDEVTMEEFGQAAQLRAGELIIIVVVLIMWAGVIALFCRQYDIIKDNEPNNNKDKAKNSSECSTPEHPQGGLLRSNV